MAREYARIRIDIADDEDFEGLSMAAQWLYTRVLIPEPTLNQAGAADWRPKRLLTKAQGLTLAQILAAAAELECRRYVLLDLDTEEILVRSYIRRDELLRNPKMAASVVKAYRAVSSRTLRAAIVTEVRRTHDEHPTYTSWTNKDTADDLSRLMARPGFESVEYTNQITVPDPVPNTDGITNRITDRNGDVDPVPNTDGIANPAGDPITNRFRSGFPAPAPAPFNLHHESGYVSTEGHQRDATEPPTPNCPQHPDGTTTPCRACGDARRARSAWDAERDRAAKVAVSTEARERAELRRAAIAECNLCDDDGYRAGRVCEHDPDAEGRVRRGIELARAAIAKPATTEGDPDA